MSLLHLWNNIFDTPSEAEAVNPTYCYLSGVIKCPSDELQEDIDHESVMLEDYDYAEFGYDDFDTELSSDSELSENDC